MTFLETSYQNVPISGGNTHISFPRLPRGWNKIVKTYFSSVRAPCIKSFEQNNHGIQKFSKYLTTNNKLFLHLMLVMMAICKKADTLKSPMAKAVEIFSISVNIKEAQNGRGPRRDLARLPTDSVRTIIWTATVCMAWISEVTWYKILNKTKPGTTTNHPPARGFRVDEHPGESQEGETHSTPYCHTGSKNCLSCHLGSQFLTNKASARLRSSNNVQTEKSIFENKERIRLAGCQACPWNILKFRGLVIFVKFLFASKFKIWVLANPNNMHKHFRKFYL